MDPHVTESELGFRHLRRIIDALMGTFDDVAYTVLLADGVRASMKDGRKIEIHITESRLKQD
jgi:hypothetical protein